VEGDESDGFTETHQVLIRIDRYGNGMDIARRLEENNIVTNYQALPDDKTFLEPSGIRMGVQEMTRFGMTEKDFDTLADMIGAVIIDGEDVAIRAREYRQNFLEMKYCLPASQAVPLAARIMQSIFPHPGFAENFAENLQKLGDQRAKDDTR